jgi:hypothetical protein
MADTVTLYCDAASQPVPDIHYRFTAPVTGSFGFRATSTSLVNVADGPCGTAGNSCRTDEHTYAMIANQSIIISVERWGGGCIDFTFTVRQL